MRQTSTIPPPPAAILFPQRSPPPLCSLSVHRRSLRQIKKQLDASVQSWGGEAILSPLAKGPSSPAISLALVMALF